MCVIICHSPAFPHLISVNQRRKQMPESCCTSEKQTGKMGVENRFLTTECFKLSWSLQTLFAGAALGRPGAEYNGKFELLVPNSSRCGDGTKSLNLIALWPRTERISGMLKWGLHYHVTQYELSSHTDDRLVYFILVVFFFRQHARYWVCGSSLYSCTAMCPQCQSVPVF